MRRHSLLCDRPRQRGAGDARWTQGGHSECGSGKSRHFAWGCAIMNRHRNPMSFPARRWMGPGGPRGLQSRCETRRTSRVCSIRTRLRHIRRKRSLSGLLVICVVVACGALPAIGWTVRYTFALKATTPPFHTERKGGVSRMPIVRSNGVRIRRWASESVRCNPDRVFPASLPTRVRRRRGA